MNSNCLGENGDKASTGDTTNPLKDWENLSQSTVQLIKDMERLPPDEMVKPANQYDLLMILYLIQRVVFLHYSSGK